MESPAGEANALDVNEAHRDAGEGANGVTAAQPMDGLATHYEGPNPSPDPNPDPSPADDARVQERLDGDLSAFTDDLAEAAVRPLQEITDLLSEMCSSARYLASCGVISPRVACELQQ